MISLGVPDSWFEKTIEGHEVRKLYCLSSPMSAFVYCTAGLFAGREFVAEVPDCPIPITKSIHFSPALLLPQS